MCYYCYFQECKLFLLGGTHTHTKKTKVCAHRTGKVSGLKIGHFALNVVNFPIISATTQPSKLSPKNIAAKLVFELMEGLVHHCVGVPLTIELLNSTRFMPKSENESLHAGLLQLTDGTMLILDETAMTEGSLGDLGSEAIYIGNLLLSAVHNRCAKRSGHPGSHHAPVADICLPVQQLCF